MARQRGFALIEFVVAGLLATLIAVWASQSIVNKLNDASVVSTAHWMDSIDKAARSYLVKYSNNIKQAQASDDLNHVGFLNWAQPTIDELKQAGFLAAGFPAKARLIEGANIRIFRSGFCPSEDCVLSAIIFSKKALLKSSGVVDEQMLAQWIIATQGRGGTIHPQRSNKMVSKLFEYDNPLPDGYALPAGTVAFAILEHELSETGYLRVHDQRDPQFQNDLTVANNINALGNLSTDGHIKINSNAQWLSPCSDNGAISFNSNDGLLMCKHGMWQTTTRSLGGFSENTERGCYSSEMRSTMNPVTGSCSCPLGSVPVLMFEGVLDPNSNGVTYGYICVN